MDLEGDLISGQETLVLQIRPPAEALPSTRRPETRRWRRSSLTVIAVDVWARLGSRFSNSRLEQVEEMTPRAFFMCRAVVSNGC